MAALTQRGGRVENALLLGGGGVRYSGIAPGPAEDLASKAYAPSASNWGQECGVETKNREGAKAELGDPSDESRGPDQRTSI